MTSENPGWWSRNWKWAAPSGCLLVLLLLFGGCAALVVSVFGVMKNTGAYEQAMTRLERSPEAIAVLGEPIEASWMISGNVSEDGARGEANYSVPVSGPRGSGTLYVEARKSAGRWTFRVLTLVPAGDAEQIDLRTDEERDDAATETAALLSDTSASTLGCPGDLEGSDLAKPLRHGVEGVPHDHAAPPAAPEHPRDPRSTSEA